MRPRGLWGLVARFGLYDWGDVGEWLWRHVGCPLIGHRWRKKMYDEVCENCRISRPREDRY